MASSWLQYLCIKLFLLCEKVKNSKKFELKVDHYLKKKNTYYNDLITGNILLPLKITCVEKNGFINYMRSIGKLGGQNKVPRLSNDRKLAEALQQWVEKD